MNEREAFEAYWNSLADDPDSTPEVIARCRYSAMNAWQAALAQPAPEAPPEFCCESAWRDAQALAWKGRNLDCGCDHNQSCIKCWPLDFRAGGKWDKYKPVIDGILKGETTWKC